VRARESLCLNHCNSPKRAALAELCGVGSTADSTDMVNPDTVIASEAMRLALDNARLAPTDIDYVNACGAATIESDRSDTHAIKKVFGKHAPITLPCLRQNPCTAIRWARAVVSRRSLALRQWKRAGCRQRLGWMRPTPSVTSTTYQISGVRGGWICNVQLIRVHGIERGAHIRAPTAVIDQ
jgi:hypothetical protein